MGTLNEDLLAIKTVEDTLIANKVANFAYTDEAYTNNNANGVTEYNVNNAQNIPVGTPSIMKVNPTILTKGWRAQASSITRMLMNHFLGRISYNLNKVNDNMSSLVNTMITHRPRILSASDTTIIGAPIQSGETVRIMFTADIVGSDTTTVLSLDYNEDTIDVKVNKNGTLSNFTAMKFTGTPDVYKYIQANTILELMYDGTDFIIVGNPIVISGDDFTIYADGKVGNEAVGFIKSFDSESVPYGYLVFNGQSVNREDYPKLWTHANDVSQVGVDKLYNIGDGSTTFTLADLRETSLKGYGETSRSVGAHVKSGGLAVGEFIDDRIQSLNVKTDRNVLGDYTTQGQGNIANASTQGSFDLSITNARQGATTEVKAVGVVWAVKAM